MATRCLKCIDCIKESTGNICPIINCAKGLVNGPCGGSQRGCCEISNKQACAWMEIFKLTEPAVVDFKEPLEGIKDYSIVTSKGTRAV